MLDFLRPSQSVKSLDSISPSELNKQHIDGLIIDLDNTMTPWNEREVGPKVTYWFTELAQHGIKSCVVSNNSQKQRVAVVADALGIPFVYKATKPRRRAFYKAMEILGTSKHNTAVIGDQLFTDILGGNRLGLYTILVVPISKREWVGTRVMRYFERFVVWSLNHMGGTRIR